MVSSAPPPLLEVNGGLDTLEVFEHAIVVQFQVISHPLDGTHFVFQVPLPSKSPVTTGCGGVQARVVATASQVARIVWPGVLAAYKLRNFVK